MPHPNLRRPAAAACLLFCAALFCACGAPPKPPNVLFLAVDDLRPQTGAYGESGMVTPNFDRFAAQSRLFERHYVQVPTCGASRYALLTGTRPSSAAHTRNDAIRDLLPKTEQKTPESFAHLFRRAGYRTVSIGKISHYVDGRIYSYAGEGEGEFEMPFSWDRRLMPYEKWGTAWNAFFGYADGSNRNMERGAYPPFEKADAPDTAYPDGLIAEQAAAQLRELQDEPFLLAVGFFKPHLPFTAPAKYWDLYDRAEIDISPNPDAPQGVNPASLHPGGEMFGNYRHDEEGGAGVRVSDDHARLLRRAYYASVSFVDAQVGKVLDELDRLGLADNTIVVVWGDHGWHLGDHAVWGKHTTFERSLRSVLMMRVPGMSAPGAPARGIVETLDIYPTLADYAGLDAPAGLTGSSLRPLLEDPAHPGKDAAFGYWRGRLTMRTERYRIVKYEPPGDGPEYELFDHRSDPHETVNVAADRPETAAALRAQLEAQRPQMLAPDSTADRP